ncbi:MAG: hypothetical protein IJQ82_00720 [Selenomonadaceae bacterium]|nr:hypothetical protein [Selenomonadaceae bacterium]
MSRTPNKFGGGAQTNINGLKFEQTTSLDEALITAGFFVENYKIYNRAGDCIGMSVPKKKLYKKFFELRGVDYKKINSKPWEPDECFINFLNRTAYVIEKKFQNVPGSVDEKLPGCGFKKWEYEKLFAPLEYKVEFIYVFNDWFKQDSYRDVKEYIRRVGCHYFFNEVPLDFLQII